MNMHGVRQEELPLQEDKKLPDETATDLSKSTDVSVVTKKVRFSGTCSFLVSLLGYSMGASDFWRFPYLVFKNGGGIGFTFLVINIIYNMYFNILRAWVLEYLINSFRTDLPWKGCQHEWNRPGCVAFNSDTITTYNISKTSTPENTEHQNVTDIPKMTAAEQFWQYKVLQLSPGFGHFDGILWNLVLYVFVLRLIVCLCMVMYATVFVPILLMLIIWVRSMTLEGSVAGMLYYITPTMERLSDPTVWLEAALMACYTLGPGWGNIPMIGSFNKFHGNAIRNSLITTAGDSLSAVLSGLICFSVLGVMAHDSRLDLEKTVTSGLSLGFTVYPTAFTYFPLPQLWSAIFFINLILVGLDTQVLSTETIMSCCQDLFPKWFKGRKRLAIVALINMGFFLLSIPLCTRGGMYIFQLFDWYATAWTVLFVCFVECIVFTWVYGTDRLSNDVSIMTGKPLPTFIRVVGAFVTPAIIFTVLILSFVRYKPPSYGDYHYPSFAEVIGWCLALLVISPILVLFSKSMIKTRTSSEKILQTVFMPSPDWGPNDDIAKTEYDPLRTDSRDIIGIMLYNLTGKREKYLSDTCDISD